MQLEQHIREILRQRTFVAIPSIGSFFRSYTPARIDEKSNTIYPPAYRYGFDGQRTFDDCSIANYLSATYGISEQQALRCVQEWVSTVEARLASGETVTFDGVGTLSMLNDTMAFTNAPAEQTASTLYGLAPVPLPAPIKRAKGGENKRKKRSAVLIPLFLILLGGGGYAAYYFLDWPYIISKLPWNSVATQPTAVTSSPAHRTEPAVTTPPRIIDSVAAPTAEQSALALVDSSLHQRNALQPTETNTVYYIVAGSFRIRQNAENQVQELLNLGFKDPKIRQENEYYQVYLAYYTSLSHAQAKLNELWQKHGEDFCFLNKVTK